jgi:alpha-glutamyl/putrescinyl thymine pyrophosphorylase clade 1
MQVLEKNLRTDRKTQTLLRSESKMSQVIETDIGAIKDPVDRLVAFIKERGAIKQRREAGKHWPWTVDRILATWRFCNIEREADRTTLDIAKMWRGPNADDPYLFFARGSGA